MNITTGNVNIVRVELTEAEVRSYMLDPEELQNKLAVALRGFEPAPGPAAAKPRRKLPANHNQLTCSHCQRKFAGQGWLDKHLAKMHPDQ